MRYSIRARVDSTWRMRYDIHVKPSKNVGGDGTVRLTYMDSPTFERAGYEV